MLTTLDLFQGVWHWDNPLPLASEARRRPTKVRSFLGPTVRPSGTSISTKGLGRLRWNLDSRSPSRCWCVRTSDSVSLDAQPLAQPDCSRRRRFVLEAGTARCLLWPLFTY